MDTEIKGAVWVTGCLTRVTLPAPANNQSQPEVIPFQRNQPNSQLHTKAGRLALVRELIYLLSYSRDILFDEVEVQVQV